jgi:hypothetical protein
MRVQVGGLELIFLNEVFRFRIETLVLRGGLEFYSGNATLSPSGRGAAVAGWAVGTDDRSPATRRPMSLPTETTYYFT